MFLGAFHFDGPVDELTAAYDRMLASYPPDSLQLHIGVVREDGITVYDACPSRADFEHVIASDELRGALAAAGLPWPRAYRAHRRGTGGAHRAATGGMSAASEIAEPGVVGQADRVRRRE